MDVDLVPESDGLLLGDVLLGDHLDRPVLAARAVLALEHLPETALTQDIIRLGLVDLGEGDVLMLEHKVAFVDVHVLELLESLHLLH